jgi:hypothetical protein
MGRNKTINKDRHTDRRVGRWTVGCVQTDGWMDRHEQLGAKVGCTLYRETTNTKQQISGRIRRMERFGKWKCSESTKSETRWPFSPAQAYGPCGCSVLWCKGSRAAEHFRAPVTPRPVAGLIYWIWTLAQVIVPLRCGRSGDQVPRLSILTSVISVLFSYRAVQRLFP